MPGAIAIEAHCLVGAQRSNPPPDAGSNFATFSMAAPPPPPPQMHHPTP